MFILGFLLHIGLDATAWVIYISLDKKNFSLFGSQRKTD
jgi:hypothetical protein